MEWKDVWRSLFPRRSIEADVDDEITFHIEERVRERVRAGWDEAEARREVMQRFGDVDSVQEACRAYTSQRVEDQRWRMMMDGWARDVKYALRGVRKAPGFAAAVVTTLALGVGATTAVFSVLEGVVLRPLPFPEPDRLAVVWQNDRASGTVREEASTSDYFDYLERNRTFEDLAIYGLGTAVLSRDGTSAVQLNAAAVSRNMLGVLGLDPQLGRGFTADEDRPGGPDAVMLTDRIWREAVGADPAVVGRTLVVDDRPHEVVGVLPGGIDYPAGETDVWLPIRQDLSVATRPNHWVRVVGRLAPDATVESAQRDMTRIMSELEVEYPNDNTNRGAFVEPLQDVGRGDLRQTLWVLFAAVLAVLAISFVNVANLLLARGSARVRELAVLTAMGAGSGTLLRRFFVEGLVLTVASAAAGVALASGGVRVLSGLAPAEVAILGRPEMNAPVLLFALGVSALVCLGFGLTPWLQTRRLDVQRELKDGRTTDGGAAGIGLRRVLVSAQLGLAVVLLLGATLLIGTVRNLQGIDPGFEVENRLRVDFMIPEGRYPDMSTYPNWPGIFASIEALEDAASSVPGVRSSAVLLNHPLDRGFTNSFRIDGQPYDPSQGEIGTRLVTPGYFETVGLELVAGRLPDASDRVETPGVIVLNRAAADRYFPAGDAIGQRLAFWGPGLREVVGIVENERMHGLAVETPPAMYVSLLQSPPRPSKMTLMVSTDVEPLTLVDGIRAAVAAVDPGIPIFNVATMETTLADSIARERFASTLLAVFALVAVFLAVLGVHGVLSYLVAQRGHEVGVRMALGADRGEVVGMIVRQGASMALVGVAVGLSVAALLSGALQSMLFGVSATAPLTYVVVGLALAGVAVAATALPAHRAASIDPVRSLRAE